MKKITSILLFVFIILSIVSCSGKTDETKIIEDKSKYDIDLTKMSSTMVYAEVYNFIYNPNDYVGKYIKMDGQFAIYEGEDRIYFACIVADATACCSQGIEFVLDGDYKYPDDYPELGTNIVVEGTFELYEEDGYLYCQLANAKMST